jgi:hypothetical protein
MLLISYHSCFSVFEFIAPDGSAVSLREAMQAKNIEHFHTGFSTRMVFSRQDGGSTKVK